MTTNKKLEKTIKEEKTQLLIKLTGSFCNEFLDDDYKKLCEKLIRKMARKRKVPFHSGKIEIWAAAIIYALGSINFLFDKNFKPYASADDICEFFSTSKSTTSQKARAIKDMFNLNYYDEEFSTRYMKENNPFSKMSMINGFIIHSGMSPIFELLPQRDSFEENDLKKEDIYIIKTALRSKYAHSNKMAYRILAIQGKTNLYDLAETIVQSFNFDFDHLFGFYDNIKNRTDSNKRYELPSDTHTKKDSGSEIKTVTEVMVNEVFNEIGKKMLFLYDYGDEWHFIVELVGTDSPEPDQEYPYIIKSSGKAPSQYMDDEIEDTIIHEKNQRTQNSLHPSQTSLDTFK